MQLMKEVSSTHSSPFFQLRLQATLNFNLACPLLVYSNVGSAVTFPTQVIDAVFMVSLVSLAVGAHPRLKLHPNTNPTTIHLMDSTKLIDARLAVLKHITTMMLVISSDDDDMTDAERQEQYNDAEEFADLLLESMQFEITGTADDGTISVTCTLLELEAFLDAKANEYLVAEEL